MNSNIQIIQPIQKDRHNFFYYYTHKLYLSPIQNMLTYYQIPNIQQIFYQYDQNLQQRQNEKQNLYLKKNNFIQETKDQVNKQQKYVSQQQNNHKIEQQQLIELQQQRQELENQLKSIDEEIQQLDKKQIELENQDKQIDTQNQICLEQKEKNINYIKDLLFLTEQFKKKKIENQQERLQINQKNKKLLNKIIEQESNIRIFCRVRPFLEKEIKLKQQNSDEKTIENTQQSIVLTLPDSELKSGNAIKDHKFTFNRVFGINTTQEQVFKDVKQFIQSSIDGYKVCIFAYGQTGSGKTHTMEGIIGTDQQGVIPRAIEYVFKQIEDQKQYGWNFIVKVAFQEIYLDEQIDLIEKQDNKNKLPFVQKILDVNSTAQVLELLKKAKENRKVASTIMNSQSSRSHFIFQLFLNGQNVLLNKECQGSLNLIDLAGSEKLNEVQTEGQQKKETIAINKSLTTLGDVINALKNNQTFISYRNSKLTTVLQQFLGGDSKTLMIVNISPVKESFQHSLQSLRFADKVISTTIPNILNSSNNNSTLKQQKNEIQKKKPSFDDTNRNTIDTSNINIIDSLSVQNQNEGINNKNLKENQKNQKNKIIKRKKSL